MMARMTMVGAEYCWCGIQVHEPQNATNPYFKGSVLALLAQTSLLDLTIISDDSL